MCEEIQLEAYRREMPQFLFDLPKFSALQNLPVENVYPGTTMIVMLTLPTDNHRKKTEENGNQKPPSATEQKP